MVALPHFAWIVTDVDRELAQPARHPIAWAMMDLFPMPGCRVDAITLDGPDRLHVAAHGTRPAGRCPDCSRMSRAVHSRYCRHPADLPSLGRRVGVELRVRRFYCCNPGCARRTFAERLPELVVPHARRTCRLDAAQGQTGVAPSGRPATGCFADGLPSAMAARRVPGCCGAWRCRRVRTRCCA